MPKQKKTEYKFGIYITEKGNFFTKNPFYELFRILDTLEKKDLGHKYVFEMKTDLKKFQMILNTDIKFKNFSNGFSLSKNCIIQEKNKIIIRKEFYNSWTRLRNIGIIGAKNPTGNLIYL